MKAIVYVNTPLEAPEHAALAALARREGRAKGQQLRLLAIQAMRCTGTTDGACDSEARTISAAGSGDAALAAASPALTAAVVVASTRTSSRSSTRKGSHP